MAAVVEFSQSKSINKSKTIKQKGGIVLLAEQRARAILQQVTQRQTVSVVDLCQITGASEATIRRDLNTLARQGRLVKIHGGATSLEEEEFLAREPDLATKQRYAREKERIARYAAGLVGEDDVVYLDTGTTVLHMANYLKDSGALFVTSSIDLAGMLSAHECHVYILGGTLKPGTVDIVGAEALAAIRRYNFTKVFLGTSGVSVSRASPPRTQRRRPSKPWRPPGLSRSTYWPTPASSGGLPPPPFCPWTGRRLSPTSCPSGSIWTAPT